MRIANYHAIADKQERIVKKTCSLLFKFGMLFSVFTIVTIAVTGILLYVNQADTYKDEQEKRIQEIATYLEKVLQADGGEFLWYQDYFLEHTRDIRIPIDFGPEERDEAATEFQRAFAEAYPGQVLGEDVDFYELPDELQEMDAVYSHMYYLLLFEQAREDFHVMYTYYITPFGDEPYNMCYVLDALREEYEEDGKKYILVTDDIYEDPEKYQRMWEAWETGLRPSGYDTFDNEYGKTYAYYTPLFIGERKAGVIGVEIEISDVNEGILKNTLGQLLWIAIGLVMAVTVLLWFINDNYISKIERLSGSVREYAEHKDSSIADQIGRDGKGGDEIAALSNQTAAMIMELDNYMKSLVATTQALSDSNERAEAMHKLAHKDNLTGVRNKTAYDKAIGEIDWNLAEGESEFGLAMIDLNFLKQINDTYGHEKGDIAIKKLSAFICEVFKHSPVYRVGGDEFVVILKGRDYNGIERLTGEFNKGIESMMKDEALKPWERVSAAIGYALYDKTRDSSAHDVFKRADKAMYSRKKAMKAVRDV